MSIVKVGFLVTKSLSAIYGAILVRLKLGFRAPLEDIA